MANPMRDFFMGLLHGVFHRSAPWRSARAILVGAFLALSPNVLGQPDTPSTQPEQTSPTQPEELEPETVAPPAGEPSATLVDADRILNMRRLLDSDRRQKQKLETELASLETDFEKSAQDFERMDSRLTAARAKLEQAADEAERQKLGESVRRLQGARANMRARFEIVIDRRKAVQQQIATLTEKLALEQEYLQRLSSADVMLALPPSQPANARPPEAEPPASPPPLIPGLPAPATGANASVAKTDEAAGQFDEDLRAAKKDREIKLAALRDAETRVTRLDRAVDVFERDLASTRELLGLAKKAVETDEQSIQSLEGRIKERREAGTLEEELSRMSARRDELRRQLQAGQEEIVVQSDRVTKSELTLERLKKSRADAARSVVEREADLRAAERLVWFLGSPMAPYQLTWWFTNKGPRVVIAVVGAFLLYWVSRRIGGRLLGKVLQRSGRGDASEREGRAETLRRVFDSTAGILIVVLGILTALNQAGVNVTVLLGGAAVIGAAIAFGSQNLIKDYFSGFMILMENQYSVGNVIKVGLITGTVENITLRMTSLRDLEGVLHFIPHSQVLSVSNLTYGWSRIVMDVKVNVAEDPDKVMDTIMRVAQEMKRDAQFGPQILGEPEMLGVDQLGGAAMLIKVLVKTKPLNRWGVKRELLRRIKKQFDAAGIKIA